MMGAITSSNIGANSAAALSDCVCFAEVANKADPRRTIALSYSKRHLSLFKDEKLRRYHSTMSGSCRHWTFEHHLLSADPTSLTGRMRIRVAQDRFTPAVGRPRLLVWRSADRY
jgi:hypothetical protein